MKKLHVPVVDASYWAAITLASVSGTNLGDLYAHDSGLGIGGGLAVLAVIAAIVFFVEQKDSKSRLLYYWLAIIIIRTGATNIADFLAFRVKVSPALLGSGLIAMIAIGAYLSRRTDTSDEDTTRPPGSNALYWVAMLGAGVFGTVAGDVSAHFLGLFRAAVLLSAVLLAVLFAGRRRWTDGLVYWSALAVARTAGTAIGDFIAESQTLHIGLLKATLLTTAAFIGVVVWRGRNSSDDAVAAQ